ncbi:serine/threonine-protein kinase pim-2-like [Pimephales promelas]|nr:serine/threonine-protein kinase pim-2-like [Pimephales promelas]
MRKKTGWRTLMAQKSERRGSALSRSGRAASTQTAGLEVWRLSSDGSAPLSSEFSGSVFTGQDHRKRQSGSQQNPDGGLSGRSRSSQRVGELSLSSRGSCIVEWRWSGLGSDGPSEQNSCGLWSLSASNSLREMMCPPLPGQVLVEPAVTANGLIAQGAVEASPANKSSTEYREKKGLCGFLRRVWKAMKRHFGCRCHCSAVNVVEPFIPPPDLDPEPDPDHSAVKHNHESFASLFEVGEMIGSGGFGRVYEGMRKLDGKKVAIKQISKTDNNRYLAIPGHPEPLVTEVALLLMMRQEPRSPHVIQLYEWFEHPRKFTLVMEYPEPCESLLDLMHRSFELDEPTAQVIMRQAVLAVQHCIEHGVFHNDIHPGNFLINKNTLELKLIDFGCGQLLSSDGYESRVYFGLRTYYPPEVFTDRRFHAVPTNAWALGVLLYEMTNACPPFVSRKELTRGKVIFVNPNLSKGNNKLAVLGGGLELVT